MLLTISLLESMTLVGQATSISSNQFQKILRILLIPIAWIFPMQRAIPIRTKQVKLIIQMAIIELIVMGFEVMFLYRELVDAVTPWIVQQTGVRMEIGFTMGIASTGWEDKTTYEQIDLDPLEYLSRRVTVRLTYLDPIVAKRWRDNVPSRRVRIWTVPGEVMEGWKEQMEPGVELAKQERFWKWVKDNVDFRVRARKF